MELVLAIFTIAVMAAVALIFLGGAAILLLAVRSLYKEFW
jgi:hypothetical protein